MANCIRRGLQVPMMTKGHKQGGGGKGGGGIDIKPPEEDEKSE